MSKERWKPVLQPGADPSGDRLLDWLKALPEAYGMGLHDTKGIDATVAEIVELRAKVARLEKILAGPIGPPGD